MKSASACDVVSSSARTTQCIQNIGPIARFGDNGIFDAKLCLMTTMECEKHERLLQGLCDLLKDIQTDLSITEQGIEELHSQQMLQPYNPGDSLITDTTDAKSYRTAMSDIDTPSDCVTSKPLQKVQPLQRQEKEPESPNQMMMSKFYFRSMSNPCVCVPNLSSRLMKFDKHIMSFLHKIDQISGKVNQLASVNSVTFDSIPVKPFARFLHSVNTTYNYVEYLLDMTVYRKNSDQPSQIEENVEEIERGMTLGSSFLKSGFLTCRCCSNCVWIIRMFCGTSLRKLQNLNRLSVQQRAQLMKLPSNSTITIESPPWQKKDCMPPNHEMTTDSTAFTDTRHVILKYNHVKPVSVSGVHNSYKIIQKQEEPINRSSSLSSPGNQPWYPPLPSTPGNDNYRPKPMLSPEVPPWCPLPVTSSRPIHPPMVSPPFPGNTKPPVFPSPPSCGPRLPEPDSTSGSLDLRRQCIALRDEDPLHVLSSDMRDYQIGLPFGGNSLQDQDYRQLPPVDNRSQTPPDHQRRYHRNFRHDNNYRSSARRPFKRYRYNYHNVRHRYSPSSHYNLKPFTEVDFTSAPSRPPSLMSLNPQSPSSALPTNEQTMNPTSPFFASRSRPVGKEMNASSTHEPGFDSPSSRPSCIHTDHQEDHTTNFGSNTTPTRGAFIPAIVNQRRSSPTCSVRQPTLGRASTLVLPSSSRLPEDMVEDSALMSSPSLNVTNAMDTPPSRPVSAMVADSIQVSIATTSHCTLTSSLSPPSNMLTDISMPPELPRTMLKSKHSDTIMTAPQQAEGVSQDIRQVIDETVNVKSCSTFSMKSFNPFHKARKFMTKCKELTSRKKQIKLVDAGSSLWQQEDGFQWVELNGKDQSPTATTTEKHMVTGLESSPLVEQELKSPSNMNFSQPSPSLSATSAKLMSASSSTNASTTPMKKSSECESPKTPVSSRCSQSRAKKTSEGRSPKAAISPSGVQSRVKKPSESKSPKAQISPRDIQSSVRKSSEGRSPKTRVSPRVKKSSECKSPKMPSSPKGPSRVTQQDKSSVKQSMSAPKRAYKPLHGPPSRKDIELCIESVKSGVVSEPQTSLSPTVLRLPLKCERTEPSSKSTVYVDIATEDSPPRTDTSCSLSNPRIASSAGDSCHTKSHDKLLPSVMPDQSSVRSGMKSSRQLSGEDFSPYFSVIESKKKLTPTSSSQRPVTSLASTSGPTRKIAPRHQLLSTYALPGTISALPIVNRNVTLTPGSSLINANTSSQSFVVQTSTPKPLMSSTSICQQVEIIQPGTSSPRHLQLVTTDGRYSKTISKNQEPTKSTQWIKEPPKVSLIPPRLIMKITKNAEMANTYHVSSIQTNAGTPTLHLTNVKYGQRSVSVPPSTPLHITTLPFPTSTHSVATSKGIAMSQGPLTSQGIAMSQGPVTLQGIATSQGPNTPQGITTSEGPVTSDTLLDDAITLQATSPMERVTTIEATVSKEATTSHDSTCDSGSSTPDRLVIVTNGNLDDEFNSLSHQGKPDSSRLKGSNCSSQAMDVLVTQKDSGICSTAASSSLSAQSVSSAVGPPFKPLIRDHPVSTATRPSRVKGSYVSTSSVKTSGRTSNTSTSTVVTSSLSSSKKLPGWTPIELPTDHSSRIPSQEARNKMFLYSKLSNNVQHYSGLDHIRPPTILKEKVKDLLTNRTMAEIMSSVAGSSQKLDTHQDHPYPKADVRLDGNPPKWSNTFSTLPTENHRCCNSVKDILAEETLNKTLQPASPKVRISRKRLQYDHGDISWVIQDKEYISSLHADHVEIPQKRRKWSSSTRDSSRTVSSDVTVPTGVDVSDSHSSQETVVRPVGQKVTIKYTPVEIHTEEDPSISETVTSQKKPLGKVMPTQLKIQFAALQKLRNTPPISFQGKVNEQRVRDVLLFSKMDVKNAYDNRTSQILPAAIKAASNHASPRYFARELVFMIFTIGELQGRKIDSESRRIRLKQSQILNPTKISAVKNVVLHKFPIEESHWTERCIPFINDSLKTLFQRKLTHSAFKWIEGIQECFQNGSVTELVQ